MSQNGLRWDGLKGKANSETAWFTFLQPFAWDLSLLLLEPERLRAVGSKIQQESAVQGLGAVILKHSRLLERQKGQEYVCVCDPESSIVNLKPQLN